MEIDMLGSVFGHRNVDFPTTSSLFTYSLDGAQHMFVCTSDIMYKPDQSH